MVTGQDGNIILLLSANDSLRFPKLTIMASIIYDTMLTRFQSQGQDSSTT
jgi:hypothetical protein